MYGLGAAYSVPEGMPSGSTLRPGWFLSFTNPDGTHSGMWNNTNLLFDSHFVNPPDSVWDSLGVRPDWMTKPETLQGDIRPADFNELHPFNPASVGPVATAPSTGAPTVLGLQTEGTPGSTFPGTSIQSPGGLPWWVWGLGAAGAAWFAFGRGK